MMEDMCLTCSLNECIENDSPCDKPLVCPCKYCQTLEERTEYAALDQEDY